MIRLQLGAILAAYLLAGAAIAAGLSSLPGLLLQATLSLPA